MMIYNVVLLNSCGTLILFTYELFKTSFAILDVKFTISQSQGK